jgi:cysteine desulfurase/selenocysteine lyase
MSFDIHAIRASEFPWTARGDMIYLNHAGTGPLPERTVNALHHWNSNRAEPWRVPDHTAVFPALRRTRELCATLIGATPGEIALVPNTSYGLSLAARSLPLRPGDVVVTHEREFPSIIYAWTAIGEERGLVLRHVPTRGGLADEDALIRALDAYDARAVVISWVGFATGYRTDLARLGRACRERGVYLVVDAMQGVGAAPLGVREAYVDVLACGAQKWLLGPWGAGFVYVRDALIATMRPPVYSWLVGEKGENYARLLDYDHTNFDDARRFEVMTLAAQDFIAMGHSIELILESGPDAVAAHIRALSDRVVAWAADRRDVRLVTPSDPAKRAGIVSLVLPDAAAASKRLTDGHIAHSLRENAIRLSPHFYNTAEEIDAALQGLTS